MAKYLSILLLFAWLPLFAADVVVATHYFYWYRWPAEHFKQPGTAAKDGHFHHFVNPEKVSYLSEDWHAGELWMMKAAGIDVALPVYWGAPGAYRKRDVNFAVAGLKPMVAAAHRLGKRSPKLGLFYDTTTLLNDVRGVKPEGGRADLTSDDGRDLFCGTVIEFFEQIPKGLWGLVDGRALVVLYRGKYAAKWNTGLGSDLRAAFAGRFPGEAVFLVADSTWGDIGQDRTTEWAATLTGPKLFPGVAQLGPGYNDSVVRGLSTPFRERENGGFYRYSWQKVVAHQPELVLIETWNEMHEGTEICQTAEEGLKYVELTAEWIAKLRQGGPVGVPVVLKFPKPRFFKDLQWGAEAAGVDRLFADYSGKTKRLGLRERRISDGEFVMRDNAIQSRPVHRDWARYVYYQVSDHWGFEFPVEPSATVLLTVRTTGPASVAVEYDSHRRTAAVAGTYTRVEAVSREAGGKLYRFRMPAVLFANRQNGGCDFRLVLRGPEVGIARVELLADQP
jgi:hypothetical protein